VSVQNNKSGKIVKLVVIAVVVFLLWFFTLQQIQNAIVSNDLLDIIIPAGLLVVFMPLLALSGIVFGAREFFVGSVVLSLFYLLFFPINIFALLAVAFLIFWILAGP